MATTWTKLAAEIWRAYATDGVASSGAHRPVKADIRAYGLSIEAALATAPLYLTSVAGTNTITATSSPTMSSYSTGQVVFLVPANTITGGATLNINSLGAKTIVTPDYDAVAAGDLIAGRLYPLVYDGAAMRMLTWPVLEGSATWDPASIADGDEVATDVTVTGAALGDYAEASFSLDVSDLVLNAQVTAANTVTCVLANNTGGAINLSSGTVRVRVSRK